MSTYADFHRRSITDRDAFWREEAKRIEWHEPFNEVCDTSHPPFATWFKGGRTNLCHNAVDRHAAAHPDRRALVFVSTETNQETVYTFAQLQAEVQRMAAIYRSLGVGKGDRVLIYMPMIAEAAFAMLACARIGAIHTVVFGGFASHALASRIDDATPKLVVSADAGSRGGKPVPYKHLLDEALNQATHKVPAVLMVDRGLAPTEMTPGRDHDYTALRLVHMNAQEPVVWVESDHPSYILYTSGTTGKPKGVQRDTAGYAVALAASMAYIFDGHAGETYFATSDIGWVVGHSYIIYGPLLAGMATIMYEGLPTQPNPGIWWELVQRYQVSVMFSAPTAVRVLRKQDESWITRYDLSSLRALFLAGEPLDEPTAKWITDVLQRPVLDNYWQTETGWPILTLCNPIEAAKTKLGSPGKPVYGYDVKLVDDATGQEITESGRKGMLVVEGPLPPGCLQTVWGDDKRFVSTYWSSVPERQVYTTFDWAMRDDDGYYLILGRTDDVINVAGHRLGTREIEESIAGHPQVAEVAVVGVADSLKGQVPVAFVTLKTAAPDARALEKEVLKVVDESIGAVARPSRVHVVGLLPKTRAGKLLRRALAAVCEGRDPGDLSTMEDPNALEQVRQAVGG